MEKSKKRDDFWDIVKGFAIFFVVYAHIYSNTDAQRWMYGFHLAIFFYVSGYFYNENKYGDDPFRNLGARIGSSYWKFTLFNLILVLLHNVFLQYGLIFGQDEYTKDAMILASVKSFGFVIMERLGGAMWFVPTLIVASALFGGVICIARMIERWTKSIIIKNISIIIGGVIMAGAGYKLRNLNGGLPYRMETSLFVMPLFVGAYFTRTYIKDVKKFLKWYIALACAIISYYLSIKKGYTIQLVQSDYKNTFVMFYFVAFSGIYLVMYLSKILLKIKILANLVGIWGKYSFEIMATHFAIIKVVDVIYSRIINVTDKEKIAGFVCAYAELRPIYLIVCMLIPIVIFGGANWLGKKVKEYMVAK